MPYCPYLHKQLSVTFDIYLDIIHYVEQQIQKALKRDTPDWWLHNEYPACFYHLKDELLLTFDWLVSIDGNNSLKQWNTFLYGIKPLEDSRTLWSTYWLSEEDVNKFKDKVKSRKVYLCSAIYNSQFTSYRLLRLLINQMALLNVMTTGWLKNLMPTFWTSSIALTGGVMQELIYERRLLQFSRSLKSSLQYVAINSSCWPVIWSRVESCMFILMIHSRS